MAPGSEIRHLCRAIVSRNTPLVTVHENLDAFHRVGQAKFLESVLVESRPYLAARVARRMNAILRAGGL